MTRVYEDPAELEGAYRFLENQDVSVEEMESARGEAGAKRLSSRSVTIVPMDQTSIELREHRKTLKFGSVGRRASGARGVHVMTALALDEAGVVAGVLYQDRWLRDETPSPCRHRGVGKRHDRRPVADRESYAWLRALEGCDRLLRQHAPHAQAWYQADQGADYWLVFDWAHEHQALLTARVGHPRVVLNHGHENYLHP